MKTYKGKINQLEPNSYLDFIPKNVIFEEEFSTLLNKKLEI
jgi:hypothetical protein